MPSRGQRPFGAKNVEPRQPRTLKPLCCMVAIAILIISLILCWCTPREKLLVKLLQNLFTTLFYFICAKEFYFFRRQWLEGLTFKHSNRDQILFMGFIPGVIAILSERDKDEQVYHLIFRILLVGFLVGAVMVVMFAFRMIRNKVDGFRTIERVPHAVGPGFAMVFSSFLENVINGKCGTPRYREAIEEYRRREDIVENYWLLLKVLILFPEARETRGSVEDLVKRDNNQEGRVVNHRLCFKRISHEYGRTRESCMEVLKVYDGNMRGYVMIAENRPLNTLYAMLEQGVISEEMFKIQFQVYKNKLGRILDQTPGCRGNYEFFHYRDSNKLDFGRAVIQKINSLRRHEELKINSLRRHEQLN